MISSLTDCIMRLERRSRRRNSGSLLLRSSGPSVYGSAWSGSRTRESPIVESWVQVNFLELVSDSEEEREVHVAENLVPIPVRPLTPGLSCPSLAERLGVNYDLWRNDGRTLDRDQSGSESRVGVSEETKWVIQGTPLVIRFGSVGSLPVYPAPPPYIGEDSPAPM